MAPVIALRPNDEPGRGILDELEKRFEMRPMDVVDDGTRRYQLPRRNGSPRPRPDVDAFDPIDNIDPDWHTL
jgi:hypothetical protein